LQAIVDVLVIFGAVFAINSQSGGMSMSDQIEEKLNKIMEKYKKERYDRDPALRFTHRYFLQTFVSQIS